MPIAGHIVGELVVKREVPFRAKVVEMGGQSYSVDKATIESILASAKKERKPAINMKALSRFLTVEPARCPGDQKAPPVADFFKALGFSSYTAIDINDAYGSLVMDLNQDLEKTYSFTQQFDLVTNIGVSEHLFDQATFFKNAHALCREGGLMLHILPFTGLINHGFFNYQPLLLEDLAHVNNYKVVSLYVADRSKKLLDLTRSSELGTFFYHYTHVFADNAYGNTFIVALLRKEQKCSFAFPIQRKYIQDAASDDIKKEHVSRKGYRRPIPTAGFFVPLATRGARHIPRKVWRRLKLAALRGLRLIERAIVRL